MIICNLANIIKSNNMTQREVSEKLNINKNTISNYINGNSPMINKDHLNAFCELFNCEVSDLFIYMPDDTPSSIVEFKKIATTTKNKEDYGRFKHHYNFYNSVLHAEDKDSFIQSERDFYINYKTDYENKMSMFEKQIKELYELTIQALDVHNKNKED